jgi:hypothetical protein
MLSRPILCVSRLESNSQTTRYEAIQPTGPSLKRLPKLLAALFMVAAMSGCGGGSDSSGSSSATATPPAATTGTINLVVQDTPSPKLTVLSFQVQITGAVIQPGSVSILPRPVTVDLAQLVSDTAFLSSTVVGSATYTSLTMTFANPQLTIVNNSGASIVTPTQTCASGAVCTFVPKINAASVTISSGVFPVTVTAGSSTGFALDLSIPDLLQSDLSATFANGTSVNLSLLPTPTIGGAEAQIDDVLGVVQSVSSDQVTIKKPDGELLVLTTSLSTAYNYPSSVCAANDASCVTSNQIITADLSLLPNGGLRADSVTFAGSPGATVAQGVIVSVGTGKPTTLHMLVHRVLPTTSAFTTGDVVDATMQAGAAFFAASTTYPMVTGGTFATDTDLMAGQEILLEVTQETATGSDGNAAFTSGAVALESSQILGPVTSMDSSAQSFALTNVWSLFSALSPAIPQLQVQTGSATSFLELSPANLTAITAGVTARVKGPLFHTTAGTGEPTMAALQVSGKP